MNENEKKEPLPEEPTEAPEERLRDEALSHLDALTREGEKLRELYPGFDLRRELENPAFRRLVAPGSGIDLRTAFEAVHRDELVPAIMAYAVKKAEEKLAGAVRSGSIRPLENGVGGTSAALLRDDPRGLTREERESIRRRVRAGERIIF